jgi:hypothetical protein
MPHYPFDPADYRAEADRARRLADELWSQEAKLEILRYADRLERMAGELEQRPRPSQSRDERAKRDQ